MATREEIRNGIAKILFPITTGTMNELLAYLHSQGVAIKVDKKINGNLVNELFDAMVFANLEECRAAIKQALGKAGYTATESLIKEEK